MTFEVGDKVKCIDSVYLNYNSVLEINKIYTIAQINQFDGGPEFVLREIESSGNWRASRFEKIEGAYSYDVGFIVPDDGNKVTIITKWSESI